jgi:hypothetical protein
MTVIKIPTPKIQLDALKAEFDWLLLFSRTAELPVQWTNTIWEIDLEWN